MDMTVAFLVKPVILDVTMDVAIGKFAENAEVRHAPATRAARCSAGIRNIINVPVMLPKISIQ
tara:strand:- start:1414 stop:1602 length:189 start_codon:yes stop_codon:yes gene_type:complete